MAARPPVLDARGRRADGAPEVTVVAPARTSPPTLRDEPAGSPELQVRRAVTLLVLSAVLPGSAQLVAGDRRVGRMALRVWAGAVVLAAVGALLWLVKRSVVLGLVTRPGVLALAAATCFALAVAVPALVVDAWRLGRPGSLPVTARRWVAALTAVLVLATSVPLVMAGRRLWAAAELVGGIFGGSAAAGASEGRYNILLLGGDAGSDRIGLRPDSVTLASIDARTGRTVLFSLPRNLQNIRFPEDTRAARALPRGWSCGDACLLNAVYTWGAKTPSLFPGAKDPGAEAMKQAVAGVTGLDVSYYVLVDLSGFRTLVDAMGGIDLTVEGRVPIGGGTSRVVGYIEPGRQHLDGYHALWYARSRHGSSDYERMQRQRCVMSAMAGQMDPGTLLARFQRIAAAGKQVVSTDIPASELGTLLDLALDGRRRPITSVQFVPPIITPSHPDLRALRTRVEEAVDAAEEDDRTQPAGGAQAPAAADGTSSERTKTSGGATGARRAPSADAAGRSDGARPATAATPRSPSAPGTDTDTAGTDVSAVCSV